jgi:hypothetical protein
MERDLSEKYGQTKRKENGRPTIKQEKRETFPTLRGIA